MKPEPVNFADAPGGTSPTPHSRTHLGWLSLCLFLTFLLVAVSYLVASSAPILRITNKPLFQQLAHLITSRDRPLNGETQDRVNILLLGMGGPGHEGAYLTDTIILLSLKPSTKQIAMLSIPRDLAVTIPNNGIRKINAANALGRDQDYPGGGEALTGAVVSEVAGMPIHYFARVDFAGFTKLIDDLGGVPIVVDRSFTDREYPTKNFGYQTIAFKAGPQRLNGDRALKYVRSRHGNNAEGSDFARARRQQKVLSALKDKLFTLSILASPRRLATVLETFGDHTRTNMEIWEMLRTATLVRDSTSAVTNLVLDSSPEGLLRDEVGLDGAYLLVPRSGTFAEVQALARNIFNLDAIQREQPTIAVDQTADRRAAEALTGQLSLYKAKVVPVVAPTNLGERSTVVYDVSRGRKPFTRQALASQYDLRSTTGNAGVGASATTLPPAVSSLIEREGIDFLIVPAPASTASVRTAPRPRSRSS